MPVYVDDIVMKSSPTAEGVRRTVVDTDGNVYLGGTKIAPTNRVPKIAKVTLGAVDTGGGIFAWQNPEGTDIIITRVILDVTTKASAACSVDVGTTATSATTTSDNLIDGLDVNAATGVFDNLSDGGTNGKTKQKLAADKWVTASVASGASAGLAGNAYIEYVVP